MKAVGALLILFALFASVLGQSPVTTISTSEETAGDDTTSWTTDMTTDDETGPVGVSDSTESITPAPVVAQSPESTQSPASGTMAPTHSGEIIITPQPKAPTMPPTPAPLSPPTPPPTPSMIVTVMPTTMAPTVATRAITEPTPAPSSTLLPTSAPTEVMTFPPTAETSAPTTLETPSPTVESTSGARGSKDGVAWAYFSAVAIGVVGAGFGGFFEQEF